MQYQTYNIIPVQAGEVPIGGIAFRGDFFVELKLYKINEAGQRIDAKVMLVPSTSEAEACGK